MEKEQYNWQQLVQYFNNPEDPALEKAIQEWRAASPDNEQLFGQVQLLWQFAPDLKVLDQLNVPAATVQLHAALPYNEQEEKIHTLPARRYKWFRVAAIGIPALLAAWWFYHVNTKISYKELRTLAGNIDSVTLTDGSRVYLDKNSTIRYPENMAKSRTLFMDQGTAFIEVAGNAVHPFILKLPQSSITVLGTAFNIQVKEKSIGITVKSGKIKFESAQNNEKTAVLIAGEGLEFSSATGQLQQFNAINSNEDAWLTHELVFVDAPLQEVCRKIETLYNVKIQLQGKVPVKKLNANFKHNKLEEILEILQAAYPISVQQQHNDIIITGR
ncbi:FecR family protein [Chitinophaga nivalis]|uniref:FecR domain-containing protein n=1 Tax=Chitinophaga nivalis TaxID=2991709 RepID=A0ABT3IF29_9BACT|nr:FecR domain-containing protein [Chitinophaga nivalis]MCW3467899.1 FecR domain-containing protein [Chitinophaga nivalis]MCW3482410.1 FecR domain-containing protein [Chitinophaga nivalis]